MYTGSYSGKRPGDADFAAVYGAEESGKQSLGLERTFRVGHQAFDMVRMPKDAIEAKVLAARPKPGSATPEQDQAEFDTTAAAARQVLQARAAAPADFVRKIDPTADAYWNAVSSEDSYDPDAYQKAIARSVAVQLQLGIKHIEPLPQSVVKTYVDLVLDLDRSQHEKDAALSDLFAGTSDPSVLAAMSGQLARAGLSRLLRGTAFELPMTAAEMQAHEVELAMGRQSPDANDPSDPTMRQKLAAWMLGDHKASSTLGHLLKGALGTTGIHEADGSLVDFTPLGGLFSADEAKRAFDKGNYGEAALSAAGVIPDAALLRLLKVGRKVAKPLEEALPRSENELARVGAAEEAIASPAIPEAAPLPSAQAAAPASPASVGQDLHLTYMPHWNAAQRAAADLKVKMLTHAVTIVSQVVRKGRSARKIFKAAGFLIPFGHDIDHVISCPILRYWIRVLIEVWVSKSTI